MKNKIRMALLSAGVLVVAGCGLSTDDRDENPSPITTETVDYNGDINNLPQLVELTFDPSTHLLQCEAVTICATAQDEDADAIEFEWTQISGPEDLGGEIVVVDTSADGHETTECIEVHPLESGEYEFEVTLFDLVETEEGLARIDDLLAENDHKDKRSMTRVEISLEVDCPEDVLGEIDEKKPKPDDEDVLGEIDDDDDYPAGKKPKPDDEDVLGEIDDEDDRDDEKKPKPDEEDVLGEIDDEDDRDDEKKPKPDDEDVLGEIDDEDDRDDEKKPKPDDEDVLGEIDEEKVK